MTRFVILAVPRTGSNLLCTLLNSHPQILCHHELFNPQGVFTARDYRGQELANQSVQQRDDDPLGFLERVWQCCENGECTGFKWTRGQDESVLRNVLEDACIRKIVLRRKNRIKTYVSERIAQETQQWEVYSDKELAMPRPRVHVDPGELLEHIEINHRFYADLSERLSRNQQPVVEVQYESLFDRLVQVKLLEFLGVSTEPQLTASSVKQNFMDLRNSIANFVELKDRLENQELLAELQDRGC